MAIKMLVRGKIRHFFFFPSVARIELVPLGTSSIRNFLIYDDSSIEIIAPLQIAQRNWLIAALSRAFFEELVIDIYGEEVSSGFPTIAGVKFYSPSTQPESLSELTSTIGPSVFEPTLEQPDLFDPMSFGRVE